MLLLLLGCPAEFTAGDIVVTETGDGALDITRYDGKALISDLRFALGEGDEVIDMEAGSYRLTEGESSFDAVKPANRRGEGLANWDLVDSANAVVGTLTIAGRTTRSISIQIAGNAGNRVRFDAACTGDDHFVGGGEHAMDVDHVGEAFPLWVSEPGIGKSTSDDSPSDWFLTGTKHATSYPDPFFIRPEPVGILALTDARVEVDLCTSSRYRFDIWKNNATFYVMDADQPIELVQQHALLFGAPAMPPDWAFGVWADAVRGVERVQNVAAELRTAAVPATVIWSEDWRGGEESAIGYHPKPEWAVDETLYPDPSGIDAGLEAQGIKWLAYFQPFLVEGSAAWEEASDFTLKTEDGEPYLFLGPSLQSTGALDLTDPQGYAWALDKFKTAAAVGFDGWMADYGEWVPEDSVAVGMDTLGEHNTYPLRWQALSSDALSDKDAVYFARSGWSGAGTIAPVHWPGDQRTSFDTDDGFPSVLALTLGDAIAGVAFSGSDIAGYQSVGNDPSDKELWMRWCALGAYSPIMRTHHGAYSDEDWQFDSDEETLAAFARWGQLHAAMFPYLRGLAEEAVTLGTPVVRPLFLHWPDEAWDRHDAWLLGPSLLVAPVLEAGVTSREVSLPSGTTWYDVNTGRVATSGSFDAPLDVIPVFAPAGAVIPMFAAAPDSLVDGPLDGLTTLSDADKARRIVVYAGEKGSFVEADGTTYTSDGAASGSGTTTGTFASGSLTAAGLTLTITGDVERAYEVEVVGG